MIQLALQPSPGVTPPSSHSSVPILRPSPHTGAHVVSPPKPLPCGLLDGHAYPASIRHSASQPSPPAVLPSSQLSALLSLPSPQACTTDGVSRLSTVVVFSKSVSVALSSPSEKALPLPALDDVEMPISTSDSRRGPLPPALVDWLVR